MYNLTTNTADATNNWWGSTWGPQDEDPAQVDQNPVSTYVSYSPWHHVNNPYSDSAVHGGETRWDGSTTYTTLWANTLTTWNDEKTNEGGGVSLTSATSTVDLTVSDSSTPFVVWDGRYKHKSTSPVTNNDMLYVYTSRIATDGL